MLRNNVSMSLHKDYTKATFTRQRTVVIGEHSQQTIYSVIRACQSDAANTERKKYYTNWQIGILMLVLMEHTYRYFKRSQTRRENVISIYSKLF